MDITTTRTNWIEGYVAPVAADDLEAKAFSVAVRPEGFFALGPERHVFTRWDLLLAAKVGEDFTQTAERLALARCAKRTGRPAEVVAVVTVRGMGRYGRNCFTIPGITREPATGLPMTEVPALF